MIGQQHLRTRGILAISLAGFLVTVPTLGAPEPGGESPEAVYDRFIAGAEAEDWEEIAACMAPDGLKTMNAMFIGMGGMMVAFAQMGEGMAEGMAEAFGDEEAAEEAAKEASAAVGDLEKMFNDLLAEYGITEESMGELDESDEVPEVLGSPALFADLMQFMEELPSDGEEDSGPGDMFTAPEGGLQDLVIDGDRATASAGGEPGAFVRIDGRWYIDLDMGMGEDDAGMDVEMEMEEEAAE